MKNDVFDRRTFLKGAVAGSAAVVIGALPQPAPAQQDAPAPAQQGTPAPASTSAGYSYLNLEEQAFVEALVDHMVPADELTPKGTDVGINIYIDRALAGGWCKGDRLYMQGPWALGTPNQGYQAPLTPAELYRVSIQRSNAYCRKTFGKDFHACTAQQKETFLKDLADGKITLEGGLPGRVFFGVLYETVMEGLFADPVYGGTKDKVGWKMSGSPGVLANNAENVKKFNEGQRFPANPVSIVDMS